MYYLYRHIRLDKNEPFYIGVGTVEPKLQSSPSMRERYKRAYSRTNRNSHWRNIVNTSEYEVEIMFETDNYELIQIKEREFISLYGRKDLEKGCLCNFTDGGEGVPGRRNSEVVKLKMSISAKKRVERMGNKEEMVERLNRNHNTKGKFGKDHPQAKKIYQYNLNGDFIMEHGSMTEAAQILKIQISHITSVAQGKRRQTGGFIWKYERL